MPNSTSIATPFPCKQCQQILSSKRNLRSHGRYDLKVDEKEMGIAPSHDAKQGGSRCSHKGKGQRGPEQSAIPCGSRDDQNFHVQDGDTENFERNMPFPVFLLSSHGSGWIIDRIEKLHISFAAFSPIIAGSYLEPPDALTNINTRKFDRCFLYYFVAAYHNVNPPAL